MKDHAKLKTVKSNGCWIFSFVTTEINDIF